MTTGDYVYAQLVIHRYWTGSEPPPPYAAQFGAMSSALGELKDWTDRTLPKMMLEFIDTRTALVPAPVRMKHRSNMARLLLLQRYGGTWLDHDVVLLSYPTAGAFIAGYPNHTPCSAVMNFRPHDPLLEEALDSITPAARAADASGEDMLGRIWRGRVEVIPFPNDYRGKMQPGVERWALHLWHHTTTASRPQRR